MSEQPPDSGAPESSPDGPPPAPGPTGPPPGYGQPRPPQPPYNPYAQPVGPEPTQPVWQGHQAPEQSGPDAPGQPPTGTRRRRTWLIVVLMVLFLAVVGGAVTAAVLIAEDEEDPGIAVADIEAETCLNSDGLADVGETVDTIEEVGCEDEHDAEVFATLELAAEEDIAAAGDNCVGELDDVGQTWSALDAAGIEVRPLVAGEDEGDKVVCFIRHRDGEPLTGSEFDFE